MTPLASLSEEKTASRCRLSMGFALTCHCSGGHCSGGMFSGGVGELRLQSGMLKRGEDFGSRFWLTDEFVNQRA